MKRILSVFLLICLAGSAMAEVSDCYKKAKTTNDSELCAAAEAAELEARLKEVFDYTITSTDEPDAASSLSEAQATWSQFREQDCHAVSYSYGAGTYRGTAYQECMLDHATQRVNDLMKWNPLHWVKKGD